MQLPRRDRGLSRAEIVAAAIAVADAEGPDAISMRRIARELRAGPMSLYWHVGSKEELLDLMLESIETEVEAPEPSGDWRADLRAFAHQARAGMLRHRWAMEFLGGRPPSGPNDTAPAVAPGSEGSVPVRWRAATFQRSTSPVVSTAASVVPSRLNAAKASAPQETSPTRWPLMNQAPAVRPFAAASVKRARKAGPGDAT